MDSLQKALEESFQSQLEFSKIRLLLIKRLFKDKGISLTKEQLSKIEKMLSSGKEESMSLNLNPDQISILQKHNEVENLNINLADSINDIEKIYADLEIELDKGLPKFLDESSKLVLKSLMKDSFPRQKFEENRRKEFESRLIKEWKKPFRLLEMIREISYETGEEFNTEFRPQAIIEKDYVFEVLSRMHARACQISSEIIVLLKSGLADGANARWRTLHEISVTCLFIDKHGNNLAEKYLHHDYIESYKAALSYIENTEILGLEPLSEDEILNLRKTKEELLQRYGESYYNNYGWAAEVLGIKSPTFDQIEKNVGLEQLRPYYRLASHNVHANPKGISYKMGLLINSNILLAGPSNYGFTDPAQLLAFSLSQITGALLMQKPNIDRCITCNILFMLKDEVANEFFKVQEAIKNRESNLGY